PLKDEIEDALAAIHGPQETELYCLVLALPDPVASVASVRFDEYLDVVLRAVELQGFVLDRSSLPWQPAPNRSAALPDRTTRIRGEVAGWGLTAETTSPQEPRRGRPGLVVFKTPLTHEGPRRILLAFIVPESPVSGIDRKAFTRSLDLINNYFFARLT